MAWDRVIGGKAKGPDLDPADRGSESPKTEAALRVQGLDARSAIWIRSGDARPGIAGAAGAVRRAAPRRG
jgi:hypothetical protein